MTYPFTVTCFRYDVGIFTAYGARIKQHKLTNPVPPKAINNIPVPRDPRFIDTLFYDVVLFTNPELTQSFACYRSKNLHKAENFLNNFMLLCSRGFKYIDLGRIPDYPMPIPPYPPHPCPPPPPHPYYPPFWGKNDTWENKIPDSELDPRYINDPRKNPWYDVFDHYNDPRYAKEPTHCPPGPHHHLPPKELDYDKLPKYDGDIITFENDCHCKPNCPPPPFRPEPPCPPYDPPYDYPPHPHPHPHPHPCPPPPPCPPCPPYPPFPPYPPIPPCPPPWKDKICTYHGDGGFAMGESVISNIKEIAPNALRTMIAKNYHSTFSNMNPADRIVVKKHVLDCILPTTAFKVDMSVAGEWSFFMIPAKFAKLVEDFNWYYKEDVIDGVWYELDKNLVQTTFSIQDNGIKYFISAVRLNGRYDMRFAKTGRDFNHDSTGIIDDDDNREIDVDSKQSVTLHFTNYNSQLHTAFIYDLTAPQPINPPLSQFKLDETRVDAIVNHIYRIDVNDSSALVSPTVSSYFYVKPISEETWEIMTLDSATIPQEHASEYIMDKTNYTIECVPHDKLVIVIPTVDTTPDVVDPGE